MNFPAENKKVGQKERWNGNSERKRIPIKESRNLFDGDRFRLDHRETVFCFRVVGHKKVGAV